MSRKVRLPQSRRHIWLYDEDWTFLVDWCKSRNDLIGPGPAIRESIHARVQFLKARQTAAIDSARSELENVKLSIVPVKW